MPITTSKSTSKTFQTTNNTAYNTNQQAEELNASNFNFGDVKLSQEANLSIVSTDFGAIQESFKNADNVNGNMLELSKNALAQNDKVLSSYFENYNKTQQGAFDIAASAAGSSWKDKALLGVAILSIVAVVLRGRKSA